jgi:hypothetical protein
LYCFRQFREIYRLLHVMLTQVLGVYCYIVRKNQKNNSTKQLITTTDHYAHITVYSLGSSILVLYEIVPTHTCRLDFQITEERIHVIARFYAVSHTKDVCDRILPEVSLRETSCTSPYGFHTMTSGRRSNSYICMYDFPSRPKKF